MYVYLTVLQTYVYMNTLFWCFVMLTKSDVICTYMYTVSQIVALGSCS